MDDPYDPFDEDDDYCDVGYCCLAIIVIAGLAWILGGLIILR